MPVADMPCYPTVDGTPITLDLGANLFAGALASTLAAMREAIIRRPALNGIALDTEAGALVATDGHRLHLAALGSEARLPGLVGQVRIIPAGACYLLQKLLKGADGIVRFSWDDKVCTVTPADGSWHVAFQWVDGKFPVYEQVIPKKFKTSVKLDGKALREILTRTSKLPISLDVGDCEIGFSAGKSEGLFITGKLPAEREGEHIKVGFNPAYLIDALNCVYPDDGPVTLHFEGGWSSVILKTADRTAVVMPVRL
jgi:DNA polymerase III sliding clamp (beta) subunit (PCNA family)